MMEILIIILLTITFSYLITEMARKIALKKNILDNPNARSSHEVPTPRGGGISIVFVTLLGMALLSLYFAESRAWFILLLISTGLIALIGFFDDIKSLSPVVRIVVHASAAAILLFFAPEPLVLSFLPLFLLPYILALAFYFLFLLWSLNLFNFMDGIDGLAGSQALFIAGCSALLLYTNDSNSPVILLFIIIAMSSVGFLFENWHPAKVFMGDVGSGYLGFLLATLGIWGEVTGELPLVTTLILNGVFIVDATITLFRRLANKEKIYEPHRKHAYQNATKKGYSHSRVTFFIVLINLFWLAPLAWLSLHYSHYATIVLIIAWIPLAILAVIFKAGLGIEANTNTNGN